MDRRRPRVPSSARRRPADDAQDETPDAAPEAAQPAEPEMTGEQESPPGAEDLVTEEIAADRRRSIRPVEDPEEHAEAVPKRDPERDPERDPDAAAEPDPAAGATEAAAEDPGEDTEEDTEGDAEAPLSGPEWRAARRRRRRERIGAFWRFVEVGNTHSTYWMLLGSTLALTAIGLIMVLSSSAVETLDSAGGAYGLFLRQATWAGVGLLGMAVVVAMPRRWLQRLAWPSLIVAVLLLALVLTPLGYGVNGNRNWLRLGPITGQPSELAKLAMALWAGSVLARKGSLVRHLQHALVPVVLPGAAVVLTLVLLGRDLGTALVFGVMIAAVLFVAGTRLRWFLIAGATALAGAVGMTLLSVTRMQRVQVWLGMEGACEGVLDPCFQPMHGIYALASGGWWGVGLGQSRQKWNYLPEAENDFIFTILGEELGLLGALTVLALFAMLVLAMFRVASRARSAMMRITTVGIMAWIIGQTFINLAMVTGLLPVIGIPLPFISYGGSALTATLLAVGVVLNFAREQRRRARMEEAGPVPSAGEDSRRDAPHPAPGDPRVETGSRPTSMRKRGPTA